MFNNSFTDSQREDLISVINKKLNEEFGNNIYNVWMKDLHFVSIGEFEVVLSLPNEFIRDYVKREYLNGTSKKVKGEVVWLRKGLREDLLKFFPKLLSLELIVEHRSVEPTLELKSDPAITDNIVSISKDSNLYNVGIDLNKNYTFDNFVVGKSNKIACETMKSITMGNNVDGSLNSLFLYGSVGIGKTHLCQALAWKIKEVFPNKNTVYISAEKFMYLFVQSCKNQDINNFKKRFRNIDYLIIDDIQFIVGKDTTQKEFFYTFETLINENKQVVLACDRSPTNLVGLDDKLKSRLNGGLIINIQDNDRELTINIIKKKCEIFGLDLSEELIEHIANHLRTDTRQLEGFLKRLQMNENIMNIKTTRDIVEGFLNESLEIQKNESLTIDNIMNKVCEYFSLNISDLKSEKKLKELVVPRHIAMYLCKELTAKSYPDIAKKFNSKTHATVLYAVKKVEKLMETDMEIGGVVGRIRDELR
ncbi:MAG: chromosomal replication initiator protein DnaA [Rickettsiales bacterium]|nr:chromosomal replication initiator protein DnaA [Rickettsiales bacterium]